MNKAIKLNEQTNIFMWDHNLRLDVYVIQSLTSKTTIGRKLGKIWSIRNNLSIFKKKKECITSVVAIEEWNDCCKIQPWKNGHLEMHVIAVNDDVEELIIKGKVNWLFGQLIFLINLVMVFHNHSCKGKINEIHNNMTFYENA